MSIRRVSSCLFLVFLTVTLIWVLAGSRLSSQAVPQTGTVISGRNVNMVSGAVLPGGDPWLQRQNEPSIAVSSRNPLHLLAGANDYRTVDMPTSEGELPGKQPTAAVGDAWLGVFTSYDGGESWTSTMLPGYPQDPSANPLKVYRAAADPVVRSGPNGLFYFSGIAFNRTDPKIGVVFVARFIDDNNKEGGGTIRYIDTKIIASGTASKFLDKPWISVDQPRIPVGNITISGQTFPRHNVYLAYSAFTGSTNAVGDIMFSRSADCGTTWGTPIKISSGSYAHQGATIAIKPVSGEVLVAWRRFGVSGKTPDSIFVAQSLSRGLNFQSPVKVADVAPFDQPTTDESQGLPGAGPGFAFRTNSYPTMTVDKSGHVYLAWAQRGVGTGEGARVVLSSSYFGSSWSAPQAVANLDENGLPFLGHQLMPSLSFAAGKLILVWYDQRHDVSSVQYGFNNWILDDLPYRHTMDVWAAEADTAKFPNLAWKSSQVSRYLHAMLKDGNGDTVYDNDGNPIVFPVQFNCVNYPLFKVGHNPFNGDYIDVAAAPTFKQDTWRNWIFNTDGSDSPVFHVAWTDNRDVRPPSPPYYDWTLYTPPISDQGSAFISGERPDCNPNASGNEPGMRNQNIYTARVTWGIEAGSPVNDKPLNLPGSIARAFVVFVKNNTGLLRSYRLTIAAQPVGGQASFEQFSLLTTLDVDIAAYSTISRTVFISSTDVNAAVTVNINETDAAGAIITGGLSSSILINGDTSNPQMSGNKETHNPNIINSANPNIINWYVNPNIINPNIINPNIINPNIINPNIINPNIINSANPNIINPNIINPNIINPNIINRDVSNPNIINPNIINPNIINTNIADDGPDLVTATDVEWTVKNEGTTTTSYTLKTLAKKSPPNGVYVQLLVYRVHYTPAVAGAELKAAGVNACELKKEPHHELVLSVVNPNIINPNIINPNIINPNIINSSIENSTFSVAPGEEVVVDLRVLDSGVSTTTGVATVKALSAGPTLQAFSVEEFIGSLGFAVTSQAVNSIDVAEGSQIPPADATDLVIGTSSLPDGVAGYSYSAALSAFGGAGTYAWSLNSGELPPGLVITSEGLITGMPSQAGTYQFIVRVDAGGQFDTQQYSIFVDSNVTPDPLAILTSSLPGGVQGHWYGATLAATGGVWPRSWSQSSGAMPEGLSLDSGGVISGTPTVAGTFSFTVRVVDRDGTIATRSLNIAIAAETSTYLDITGVVYNEAGAPLGGVVLRGLPNTPVTAIDGTYTDRVPTGWSGTALPFMAGHSFVPASRTYTNLALGQSSQDYNFQNASLSISGTVRLGGVTGLANVVMTGLPGNPPTNSDGFYTATVSYGWSGTVTPTLTGYAFTPENHVYSSVMSAQITNYTAVLVFGTASKLVFIQSPNGGVGGAVWTKQPKVQIQDADGNRITSDNLTVVTLVMGNNPGNGSLSGPFSMTVTNGEAAFAGLSINRGGNGYTLGAMSNPTLAEATSETFGIEGFRDTINLMYNVWKWHTATPVVTGAGEEGTDMVLIAGGIGDDRETALSDICFYNPTTKKFEFPVSSMKQARYMHTATSLLNGTVLIVGGYPNDYSAEIFNPATGEFALIEDTVNPHFGHRATLLQDGRVLITGHMEAGGSAAEFYNPRDGMFYETGPMNHSRNRHTSTLLPNGKVLITGGYEYGFGPSSSAELYNPETGEFYEIGVGMAGGPRLNHQATLLDNGAVLITGGNTDDGPYGTAEIYDPTSTDGNPYGSFQLIGNMLYRHEQHQAVLLRDGTVLIVGGTSSSASNEIYDPSSSTFRPTGRMSSFRLDGAAAVFPDGKVLVSGGFIGEGGSGILTGTAEVWNPLAPFPTHVISGTIMPSGPGIGGIMLVGLPGHPMTNNGGYYEGLVLNGWKGTVTPTKPWYEFDPALKTYDDPVTRDISGEDYVVTYAPAIPVKLGFAQQPTDTTVNSMITPAVVVEIQDEDGNVVGNATNIVTLSIFANPGEGELVGTVFRAAVEGVATFDDLSINAIGTSYRLWAESAILTGIDSSAFNVSAPVSNPEIWRSPISLTFAGQFGGLNPAMQILQIKNTGGGTLSYNIASDAGWLSVSPASGTSTGDTDIVNHSVASNIQGWPAGTYNATLTIAATGASNTPQTVPVTLTIAAAPAVSEWVARYDYAAVHGTDNPTDMAVDPSGNVIVVGESSGTTPDFLIIKYSNSGTKLWEQRYDGGGADHAKAVAVDTAGNVYVTGDSYTTGGASPSSDYLTIKYRGTDGYLLWQEHYDGTGNGDDYARALVVDPDGSYVYVTGASYGVDGSNDYATIKYAGSDGNYLWNFPDSTHAVRYNGGGYDAAVAVVADSSGNAYVTGSSVQGFTKIVTLRYNADGTQAWIKDYYSYASAQGTALALDHSGHLLVTGSSFASPSTELDIVVLKYGCTDGNPVGLFPVSFDDGGARASAQVPNALVVDPGDNIYLVGSTEVYDNDVKKLQSLAIKFNSAGDRLWARKYVGPSNMSAEALGVAVDGSGNVYVTGESAELDADTDYATIKYDAAGNERWVRRYNGPINAQDRAVDVGLDSAGNVCVTGLSYGSGSGSDFCTIRYSPLGPPINSVAGSANMGYSGDGGLATLARLNQPTSVTFDASGNMFIADYVNNRVRVVNKDTGIITTVAGTGTAGYNGDNRLATGANLNGPCDIAFDTSGDIYIADVINSRIRKINRSTGMITTIAGTGTKGFNGDGILATNAYLDCPSSIALDSSGNLVFADKYNQRVRKVDFATGLISTIAGSGNAGFGGDGSLATASVVKFDSPIFVRFDASWNMYIGDILNDRIRRVDALTGIISTAAGNGIRAFAGDGGPAASASLNMPHGIAFDHAGNLYIGDRYNGRVRRVDKTTGVIFTIAGGPELSWPGFGDGGPAAAACLDEVWGLAFDSKGNLYIANFSQCRIRKVGD